MSRILVVEDEEGISGAIREWLEHECYVVTVVNDGITALDRLSSKSYEAVVLDLMLPGLSGIEVCRRFRSAGGTIPILMLTARSTLSSKEEGLDSGADDYLTKPFDMRELSARIRALLRRPPTPPVMVLEACDLKMDLITHTVEKAGQPVRLQPKEFILLEVLLRHHGRALSAQDLIDHVWSNDADISPDTVRSHVKSLRKKLDSEAETSLIKTVHGVGYKLEVD